MCNEKKRINRILCRLYDLPFDHTHGISRSEFEIVLPQEWDGRLTWIEKDVGYLFVAMILTSVIMVGWVDVTDSDRGDFEHVDISSLF